MKISYQEKLISLHKALAYVPLASTISALIQVISVRRFTNSDSPYRKYFDQKPRWHLIAEAVPVVGNIVLLARFVFKKEELEQKPVVKQETGFSPSNTKELGQPVTKIQPVAHSSAPSLDAPEYPNIEVPAAPTQGTEQTKEENSDILKLDHSNVKRNLGEFESKIQEALSTNTLTPDQIYEGLDPSTKTDFTCLESFLKALKAASTNDEKLQHYKDLYEKTVLDELTRLYKQKKICEIPDTFKKNPVFLRKAFDVNPYVYTIMEPSQQVERDILIAILNMKNVNNSHPLGAARRRIIEMNIKEFLQDEELMEPILRIYPKKINETLLKNKKDFIKRVLIQSKDLLESYYNSNSQLLEDKEFIKDSLLYFFQKGIHNLHLLCNEENYNAIFKDKEFLENFITETVSHEDFILIIRHFDSAALRQIEIPKHVALIQKMQTVEVLNRYIEAYSYTDTPFDLPQELQLAYEQRKSALEQA